MKDGAQDALHARLIEAERIVALDQPAREWIVQRQAQFAGIEDRLDGLTLIDRLVRILMTEPETFEEIEREAAFYHAYGKKKRHTSYQTDVDLTSTTDANRIEDFRLLVMKLYRQHNGSGGDATIEHQRFQTREGVAHELFSLEVERVPETVQLFLNTGQTGGRLLRRTCDIQARYEPSTGRLDVVSDLGGPKLRRETADAFVELILQSSASVEEIVDPPAQLEDALERVTLEFDPEDAIKDVRRTLVRGFHPDWPGKIFTIECDDGVGPDDIERIFPERADLTEVLALGFCVEFERGLGTNGRNSRQVSFEMRSDGSTDLDRSNSRHRLIHDKYLPRWGIRH